MFRTWGEGGGVSELTGTEGLVVRRSSPVFPERRLDVLSQTGGLVIILTGTGA